MTTTTTMTTEQAAYCDGWNTTMAGYDPRYHNPFPRKSAEAYAWDTGALDAFDAEDGEAPEPTCAGF